MVVAILSWCAGYVVEPSIVLLASVLLGSGTAAGRREGRGRRTPGDPGVGGSTACAPRPPPASLPLARVGAARRRARAGGRSAGRGCVRRSSAGLVGGLQGWQ